MIPPRYGLILRQPISLELVSLFGNHIHAWNNVSYLLCSNVEPLGNFVLAQVIKDKDSPPWVVHIPVGCVAAIADMSEPHAGPGFLSGDQ